VNILISGASGFVGRSLVPALLQQNYRVVLPLKSAYRFNDAVGVRFQALIDRRDVEDLQVADLVPLCAGVDAVVHLMGQAHTRSGSDTDYERVNYQLTLRLAEAARQAQVKRFIFLSSIRAQSGVSCAHILTEANEPMPTDAYGLSKLRAEQALAAMSDLNVTALRSVLIYGAFAKGSVGTLYQLMQLGIPLPFDGLQAKRSYVAIDRLIDAVLFALERPKPLQGPYIVSDPDPLTLSEFVHVLAKYPLDTQRLLQEEEKWMPCHARTFYLPEVLFNGLVKLIMPKLWERIMCPFVASAQKLRQAGWNDQTRINTDS
jgi:nucleoside-diphosphate-sugar epimerase